MISEVVTEEMEAEGVKVCRSTQVWYTSGTVGYK